MSRHERPLPQRRSILAGLTAGLAIAAMAPLAHAEEAPITVWKDPGCGCCGGWVEHLRQNSFRVSVIESRDLAPIKAARGIPAELASCHTAEMAGYVIEGHVPAAAIKRLLAERPAGKGLAVPGMPIGSPGMEGGTPEAYDVILFDGGRRTVFGRYLGSSPA